MKNCVYRLVKSSYSDYMRLCRATKNSPGGEGLTRNFGDLKINAQDKSWKGSGGAVGSNFSCSSSGFFFLLSFSFFKEKGVFSKASAPVGPRSLTPMLEEGTSFWLVVLTSQPSCSQRGLANGAKQLPLKKERCEQ